MITRDEIDALTQLLQRTPMSHAEALWVQVLLLRLLAGLAQQEMKSAQRAAMQSDDITDMDDRGQEQEEEAMMEALSGRTRSTTDRAAAPDALPADAGE